MLDVHGRSTPYSMSKLNDIKANNAPGTSAAGARDPAPRCRPSGQRKAQQSDDKNEWFTEKLVIGHIDFGRLTFSAPPTFWSLPCTPLPAR
jgi:hypothetical protein